MQGLLAIRKGNDGDAKHRLAACRRACGLCGRARTIDDGAGRRELNRTEAGAGENAGRPRRTRTLPHALDDNPAGP